MQAHNEPNTNWEFEIRAGRAYTRAVFQRFEATMKRATAYHIQRDTEGDENDWLVQHTHRTEKIVWGQHQFKVKADQNNGYYSCECKQWEHTGLFCAHMLRVFMRLQINSIPSDYILERYTQFARRDVPFEISDTIKKGKDGATKAYRQRMLLTRAMALVRAGVKSKAGYDRAMDGMRALTEGISHVEPDIVLEDACGTSDGEQAEV